jgi:putative oxygen-independent coproporphyrinogen III oxidase
MNRRMARPFGVYVHFPYCTHRCPYCDFAVTTERPPEDRSYLRAVLAELTLRAPAFAGLAPVSLYLGGGTPSLWAEEELAELIAAVRERFALPEGAEVTLEVNPESSSATRLRAWRAAGVNRLSVGAQSFDPGVLAKLGRRHPAEAAERAIREGAEVMGDVSVDLIFGARRSTREIARADAERAARAGASHVSAYALTVDGDALAEETPFVRLARAGRLPLPDDADTAAQGAAIRAALRKAGLERYEISNFSRPGRESVHNRLYWARESYLGLGAGAYGFLRVAPGAGPVRYGNLRDARAYVAAALAGEDPTAEVDRIDAAGERNERMMLALRTRAGLPLDALGPAHADEVERLRRARLAVVRDGRLVLTARGLDVHSAVAGRLME